MTAYSSVSNLRRGLLIPAVVFTSIFAQNEALAENVVITTDITRTLDNEVGYNALEVNAHVENQATITTSGSAGHGVYASLLDGSTLINKGDIQTSGEFAMGLYANSINAVLINEGNITTTGRTGRGLYITGNNGSITNTGQITTYGEQGGAIVCFSNPCDVRNTGTLTTNNDSSTGILIRSGGNVTNTGTIRTNGNYSNGVGVLSGNNTSITNSGEIIASGTNSYGIFFTGSGNTLTLLSGSKVSGTLADFNLATGTDVVINMNSSASWDYVGTMTSLTSTGPSLVTQDGTTITIVSPTNVTTSATVGAVRNMAVSKVVAQNLHKFSSPSIKVASSGSTTLPARPKWVAWSAGYGERTQRSTDSGQDFSSSLWGGVVGLDRRLPDSDTSVGIFMGRDESRTWLDGRSHRLEAHNVYAGLLIQKPADQGIFWGGAIYAGLGDIKSRRRVEGKSALSRYTTDERSGGIIGSVGYRQVLGLGYGVTYRGHVSYNSSLTNDYVEPIDGSSPLSVDSRLTQNIGGRVEVGLDFFGAERRWQVTPRIGVEGWQAIGADATTARLGLDHYVIADDTTSNFGTVVGLDAQYRLENGVLFSMAADARRDRDSTTSLQGMLRVSVPF